MQKKKWKKITAFVLAAFMAVTLPNVPHNKYELRAENVNLFTDGDLGDDTSDDLWGESPWSFGSQSWNATNDVNYSEYAANGTASGLGIYYSAEGTVNLYETIASLEAGRYTLSGYVKDANGKRKPRGRIRWRTGMAMTIRCVSEIMIPARVIRFLCRARQTKSKALFRQWRMSEKPE